MSQQSTESGGELAIVGEKVNKLLGRRELVINIQHMGGSTPTRLQVRERAASMLGVKQSQVYVVEIRTSYGLGKSIAKVHVYNDEKMGETIEPLYIKLRNMPPEEAKKIRDAIKAKKPKKGAKKGGSK
ncbi:MAG: 30S ribosomal protein S24e [Thermocladium sp.]